MEQSDATLYYYFINRGTGMNLTKREMGDYIIFDLEEDISYTNAEELDSQIMAGSRRGKEKVVLNIQKVEYVNSFALGVLLKTMQNIQTKGGDFFLMNPSEAVMTLLKVTGVHGKFKFFQG